MADRTVVTRLRLEVGDFKREAKAAADALKKAGDDSAKAATGFDKSLAAIKKHKGELDSIAGIAGRAGLALAAGVGLAAKAYAEFDRQMSAVSATGDDARNNIDALREAAKTLGADTQYSAAEAAQGIEELLKAGVTAKDVLGGGLKGSLDLAAAGSVGVAEAAETAATALVLFGLSGSDVPHVADLLAAGAGKAQGSVGDLSEALKQGGLVASQMGLSIEETTGGLAAFASAGLLGSDAGTSLKTMLLRLANPSAEAAKTMQELGIAAYDVNGNFVGLESLAGQLETGMAGLTQGQRDAAMATIFGSDAIRAANVLYKEGAAGIAGWTAKVSDSGYAARTAAERTDNLAGDVERLMGALDSLMLDSSSGVNQTLRSLAQGAEELVEGLGKLNPETLQAALGVAAFAAAGLLGVAAAVKLAQGFITAVETARGLSKMTRTLTADYPKLTAAMGTAGRAALAMGTAFAVGAAAGAIIQKAFGPAEKPVNEYAAALVALGNGGNGAADALNRLLDAGMVGEAGTQVVDLSTAFKQLAANKNPVNEAISSMGDALGGMQSSQRQVQAQFKQLDAALTSLDGEQAAKAFRQIAREAQNAGTSNAELLATFPEYKAKLVDLANQMDLGPMTDDELVRWMGGEIPDAARRAAEGNADLAAKLKAVSGAGVTAAMSLEEATKAMVEQANAAVAASNAEIGFERALVEAAEAAKGAKGGITGNTEAAMKNRESLNDLASSYLNYRAAMEKTGKSEAEIAKQTARAANAFVDNAVKMGASRVEAVKLAISYGLIPDRVTTEIGAPGAKGSKDEVDALNRSLAGIPDEERARIIATYIDEGLKAAVDLLNQVKNKSAEVRLTVREIYTQEGTKTSSYWETGHSGKKAIVAADGGLIPGYSPHPRADNIPALLTAGEVVQSNAAGDYYGRSLLLAMNERKVPRELFAGFAFADGGQVPGGVPSIPARVAGGGTFTVNNGDVAGLAAAGVAAGLANARFYLDGQQLDVRIGTAIDGKLRATAGGMHRR